MTIRPKTVAFGLALLLLGWFLVGELRRQLRTPEERVHAALLEAVDEFNERDLDLMHLFADDYEDASGRDREELRQGLLWLLWRSGERYRAELREEERAPEVSEDGESADVHVNVRIRRGRGEDAEPWWDLEADLDFERRGRDWVVVSSRNVNHEERGR